MVDRQPLRPHLSGLEVEYRILQLFSRDAGKRDPLFAKAAHTVAAEGRAAASLLQRKMSIGYTRAARLIDQLSEHGIVGPFEGSKSREVLMDVFQVDELLADLGEE